MANLAASSAAMLTVVAIVLLTSSVGALISKWLWPGLNGSAQCASYFQSNREEVFIVDGV
jgi:hypothetical protein